jgi:hypothetical protein
MKSRQCLLVAGLLLVANVAEAALTTNSWTNTVSGLWQTAGNWSAGIPTNSNAAVLITNVSNKTVTINAATSPFNLIISNLMVQGFGAGVNTLQLTNMAANSLVVSNLAVGTNAVLTVTNSNLRVDGIGTNRFTIDGIVTLDRGSIIVTNRLMVIGNNQRGSLTVKSGALLNNSVILGLSAGSSGTLTVAGGTNNVLGEYDAGNGTNSTGAIWITGGVVIATNSSVHHNLGLRGAGQLTISNGVTAFSWIVLPFGGGSGTLTVAGGTNTLDELSVGATSGPPNTGTVWVTGGRLVATGTIEVGVGSVGRMTVSNGTVLAKTLTVIPTTVSRGTLTVAGGTTIVTNKLIIGTSACSPTGIVVLADGNLFVTNSAGTAVLDIEGGTLTQTGGTLIMDNLIITNPCARYIKTGGSFFIKTTIDYDPDLDADGDGMPNQYEIDHGLLLFNPTDAAEDKDGDGMSNLQEFLAGTDPTNSASSLRITAFAKQGSNIRVTWMMGPGKTNALERTASDASGNFTTNNFATIFTVTNTVGTTTNFLDVGAATNFPSRYYRVRLVP